MLVCSAIIGFLCLQVPPGGSADIRIEDGGIHISDTIQAQDWTLSWGRSTEWAPPRLDTTKLAKACDGATCVLYWRKCNDAAQPTVCHYAVGLDGGASVFFDVTATGADGMKHATDAISVVVDLKAGAGVKLSKLDRDGSGDQPPVFPPDSPPL